MSTESFMRNATIIKTTKLGNRQITLGKVNDSLHESIYFCLAESCEGKGGIYLAFNKFKDKLEAARAYAGLAEEIAFSQCSSFLLLDDADYFKPLYTKSDCTPDDTYETLSGRVMVLNRCFVLEHETGAHQLFLCAGEPRDGSATAFVSLLEGYEIYDPLDYYIGVMEDHRLPPWAKEHADQLRKKYHLEKPV